jgi:hypothetical protein
MSEETYYTTNYEKRFRVKRNNFWLGFLGFFGLGENPYFNILKEISTRSASQALQDDVNQLRNDCIRVIHDQHLDIQPKDKLVNTCQ